MMKTSPLIASFRLCRFGLTLIELLVVIGIVLALFGIVWTVVVMVREKAKQVECMNNLRQIYLIMKMIEQDKGHMPETLWELFGVPPNHPIRKQKPDHKFYTGPWWRYANTCFVCPIVRASEAWGSWYSCDDPTTVPPGSYDFPNLGWGHYVKKGLIRRKPEEPPPNATLACCGGELYPVGRTLFHGIGIDISGRIGRRYVPPENRKPLDELIRHHGEIGWDLIK
jgi:type II secretory pathway pseudopilin PulG